MVHSDTIPKRNPRPAAPGILTFALQLLLSKRIEILNFRRAVENLCPLGQK